MAGIACIADSRFKELDDYYLGLLLGSLFGFCIACLLILYPAVGLLGLKEYQTLVGGFIAAVGLLIAVLNVNRQIASARRMEEKRRSREFFAARLLSSHALSQLCDYAEDCCQRLKVFVDGPPTDFDEGIAIPEDFKCPPVPKEAIERLERLLKFGDDAKAHSRIAKLVNHLQIQNSRMKGLKQPLSASFFYTRLADAVEVRARCDMLFLFVRDLRQGNDVFDLVPKEPELNDFQSAMTHCDLPMPLWKSVCNALEERCEQKA
jgi:hypothetical protein